MNKQRLGPRDPRFCLYELLNKGWDHRNEILFQRKMKKKKASTFSNYLFNNNNRHCLEMKHILHCKVLWHVSNKQY